MQFYHHNSLNIEAYEKLIPELHEVELPDKPWFFTEPIEKVDSFDDSGFKRDLERLFKDNYNQMPRFRHDSTQDCMIKPLKIEKVDEKQLKKKDDLCNLSGTIFLHRSIPFCINLRFTIYAWFGVILYMTIL